MTEKAASMIIRDVCADDAAAILQIYGPIVDKSEISFEMVPPTVAEMQRRIKETTESWPWYVMQCEDQVCGYAYARPFRSREAYQHSAETTIYVHHDYYKQNVGRRLMEHLLARLRAIGHHVAIAGITIPNPASVSLHESLGFKEVGVFKEVGRKFDKWHDVGFWLLEL